MGVKVIVAYSDQGVLAASLLQRFAAKNGAVRVVGVIKPETEHCPEGARVSGAPVALLKQPKSASVADRSDEFFRVCESFGGGIVILAHFLRLLRIPQSYNGRVINVHGSLLPRFAGRGRFGRKLQREILSSRPNETGCTIHVVTDSYDQGRVLAHARCKILDDDTVDSLHRRVLALELDCLARVVEEEGARLLAQSAA
ncbi:formyltransferase family protein [Bradyrhizobium barranii]|uniref:formyltransferase family protein n=1 Tax=Bradyrhizobium TaxID=374 RepID=UPI003F29E025